MLLSSIFIAGLFGQALAQLNQYTTPTLNITAITAANGESTLECWQLDAPFQVSTAHGTTGALGLFLGDLSNATYTAIPPRFDGGFHTAPVRQFVLFTSGLIRISLLNSTDEAWIEGGKYGLLIADDTPDKSTHGHRTEYPSASDTIGFQLPLKAGSDFEYKLLHRGACKKSEYIGI